MHLYLVTTRKANKEKQRDGGLPQSSDIWGLLAPGTRKPHLGLSQPRPVTAPRAAPQLRRPPQPRPLPRIAPRGNDSFARGRRLGACACLSCPQPTLRIKANRRRWSAFPEVSGCWNSPPAAQTKRPGGRERSRSILGVGKLSR